MTDLRILTPEEVETYWDSDTLISAADIAQSHEALRAKLTEAERERDEARERLATVEADNACIRVENAKAFDTISDIASQRDEAEAALAQVREENERLAEEVSDARSYARDMDAVAKIDSQRAEQAESRCAALEQALVKVRAHTSYSFDESHGKDARIALLNGLLASIERIVDAALAPDAPATPPGEETPR